MFSHALQNHKFVSLFTRRVLVVGLVVHISFIIQSSKKCGTSKQKAIKPLQNCATKINHNKLMFGCPSKKIKPISWQTLVPHWSALYDRSNCCFGIENSTMRPIVHFAVKDEVLAKQTEIFVKDCLGDLNWDYSANKPDPTCYPPALADVIACLSRLAYDLLRPAAKPKRKRDIKSGLDHTYGRFKSSGLSIL